MRRGDIAVIAIALTIIGLLQSPQQSRLVGATGIGAALCNLVPGLAKSQRELCKKMPHAMPAVGQGAELGLRECRHQFRHHRWNCSHVTHDGVFGQVVVVGSREAAFTYAITSAGITYAITAACSRGNITACGCEPTARTRKALPPNGWEWGGCSADVSYGMRFARKFLDAREVEGDDRSLMNLHNNRAGRKIVKAMLQTECKCHGVSGSCTVRTCWRTLPSFRQIGDALMIKYYRARPVIAITSPTPSSIHNLNYKDQSSTEVESILGNDARTQMIKPNKISEVNIDNRRSITKKPIVKRPHYLVLKRPRGIDTSGISQKRIPKRSELVFLQMSPNYCETNYNLGSMGTQGRSCNRTSKGTDGCDLMCCGRGYNTHQYTKTWQCRLINLLEEMARVTPDDPVDDEPIVLPLLRSDPFNLALHNQIHLDMQNCVLEPIVNRVNDIRSNDTSRIWSPARDINSNNNHTHDSKNSMNNHDITMSGCQDYNCIQHSSHPPLCGFNNSTPTNFQPNLSAMECLAKYSQKICHEYDTNNKHNGYIPVNNLNVHNSTPMIHQSTSFERLEPELNWNR